MLTFDEKLHKYTFNGTVVPSVTTVLEAVGIPDLSMIRADVLEAACQFGTAVHKACELWDNNDLEESSLDPALKPMLDQWKRLKAGLFDIYGMPDEILIEQKLFSEKFFFAGTMDRVYLYHAKKLMILPDLKTGVTAAGAGPQTAAYAQLVTEKYSRFRTVRRYTAHLLFGESHGKLEEHKSPTDWNVFMSALNIYNFKNKR